jgi:hypothetical protein
MAIHLHEAGARRARQLIVAGNVVYDERDAWSEHQPSSAQQNEFIRRHGIAEYGRWFLGVDETKGPEVKGRYRFPYGDFERVHRCALLAAESRAGQYKHLEIEREVAHLHGMLEARPAK